MQMLAGGAILLFGGLLLGEGRGLELNAVSVLSAVSLAYLIVFGAIIGYTAYIWLLQVSTPARVATYAYVNPVVAILLGWWFADEPLTFRSMLAAAIIVGSVVTITTDRAKPRGRGTGGLDRETARDQTPERDRSEE
jgi:drug/metabolite transporter (DMT)-like permease